MFKLSPEDQLKELKKGIVDLVSEKDLLEALRKSYKEKKPLKIKAGFDPSRPDLHLGHTVLLNKMKQFQDLGHHVVFLIGDFTSMIGDPSGRNITRPPLTREEIVENSKTYAKQVYKILDPDKTEVRYNSEWFDKFSSADFIKLSGQYTLARMLERDDFKKRYESKSPISIHELLYPLVQGYDSVALKADVELGGTDQLFNLIVGKEIQKSYQVPSQCVMTVPILEGLDGVQKMSKSLDNYIAVDDVPKDMFGKTMRLSDELMIKYYELLSDLSVDELSKLKSDLKSGKTHPKEAKVSLAKFFVRRFHSEEAARKAEEEFSRIFSSGGLPTDVPEKSIPSGEKSICPFMVELGLAATNSESKRLIEGGAVEVIRDSGESKEKIKDPKLKINLVSGEDFILRAGKKKFVKVVIK